MNACIQASSRKFLGPLPDNHIILETTEKSLTSSHMETMQHSIEQISFEIKDSERWDEDIGSVSLAVSCLFLITTYPSILRRTALASCRRGDPWHRLAIVHKVQLFSGEEFLRKMRMRQTWRVIWALYTTPHGNNPFTRLYFHLGMNPDCHNDPPYFLIYHFNYA